MANPEHIAWLLEGVESWNKRYNKSQPGGYPFTPNLEGADLYSAFREANKLDGNRRIPLVGVDLEGANLAGADLSFADLTDANLTLADLTAAWLWHANLINTTLHFADLDRTNLTAAEPWRAKLDFSFIESPKQHPDNDEPVEIIQNLLHRIEQIRDFYDAAITLYFRGELNCGWELRPSIMRDDLVFFESEMLTRIRPPRPRTASFEPDTSRNNPAHKPRRGPSILRGANHTGPRKERTPAPSHAIPFLDEARRSCRQSAPSTSRDSCPLMPHRPARRAPIHR